MGAVFNSGFCPKTDKTLIREQFEQIQEQDRYENGHSYSGGFGMAHGIEFLASPSFEAQEEADAYLAEHAEKWGPALAVAIVGSDGQAKGWYIGAWCSS